MIGFPEVVLVLYAAFCITLAAYLLSLATRLVKATERIATTLERHEGNLGVPSASS